MRKLNRRETFAALGSVTAASLLAACGDDDAGTGDVTTTSGQTTTVQTKTTSKAASGLFDESASCQVTAELTEGPYYIDVDRIRSDIREDREGTRMRLAFRVRDAASCEPLENAVVEVWHCDGSGLYSGFESQSEGGPGGGSGGPTDEKTYLRGAQVTNSEGIVEFLTIYPGWYRGRTVHFHVKIAPSKASVVTTQVFTTTAFDEKVHAAEPYADDTGRDTFNDSDGIFDQTLVLTLREEPGGVLGFTTFDVQAA